MGYREVSVVEVREVLRGWLEGLGLRTLASRAGVDRKTSGDGYTRSMTTTIKVSDDLRDRLKAQAARDGLTLGAHLAHLADADDRQHRLLALQWAVAETSTEGMEGYVAESVAWERTELTDATA